MSHKIRTPLDALLRDTQLLSDTSMTTEQRECVLQMQACSNVLLSLITNVLSLSQMESGEFSIKQQPVTLSSTVQTALDILSTLASQKGLSLSGTLHEGVPMQVIGDKDCLLQIILNITANSVKFTSTGHVKIVVKLEAESDISCSSAAIANAPTSMLGVVGNDRTLSSPSSSPQLSSSPKPSSSSSSSSPPPSSSPKPSAQSPQSHHCSPRILFLIEDSGPGISEAVQSRLFRPYIQGDNSSTRQHSGTGLGLAICLRLVSIMGGNIGLKSALGKGSTFWFALPLQSSPTSPSPSSDEVEMKDEDGRYNVFESALELCSSATQYVSPLSLSSSSSSSSSSSTSTSHIIAAGSSTATTPASATPNASSSSSPLPSLSTSSSSAFSSFSSSPLSGSPAPSSNPSMRKRRMSLVVPEENNSPNSSRSSSPVLPPLQSNQMIYDDTYILVVDDNALNLKVASKALVRLGEGVHVDVALNGAEALQKIKDRLQHLQLVDTSSSPSSSSSLSSSSSSSSPSLRKTPPYDTIFMDVQMPIMDGIEATHAIRKYELSMNIFPRAHIVGLSAHVSGLESQQCVQAGMDGFISKPFHIEDLLNAVKRPPPKTRKASIHTQMAPLFSLDEGEEYENNKS
eukprot:TRINITY_DN5905_c0_g1_i1.p1 TRINITY_DN5905_c0_g1~~TRINITY_DN5905_c0_g1_i1.p1  ORF type:complete len:642 (-),score=160.34 TRINITY_DN5905_c0_g1_i1:42-1928(-)